MLETVETWSAFLQKPYLGVFASEEAVLNENVPGIRELNTLGKNITDLDIVEARKVITMGVAYLEMRKQEAQDTMTGQFNTAADGFCFGIIGSAVSCFKIAIQNKVPGTKESFESILGDLKPYADQLIDLGIGNRHDLVVYDTHKTPGPKIPRLEVPEVPALLLLSIEPKACEKKRNKFKPFKPLQFTNTPQTPVESNTAISEKTMRYLQDLEKMLIKPKAPTS